MLNDNNPMNLIHSSEEISRIVHYSDRPEFTLMQRYETADQDQKTNIVLAMIGLLIENDRRIGEANIPASKRSNQK